MEIDELVDEWLPLPEVAERMGEPVSRVRQLLKEGRLAAARRGEPPTLQVPAAFLQEGRPVKGLSGTLTLLHDNGYQPDEALRWLFTPDESLPGRPVDALRADRGVEVKRRAQAMGF